MSLLVSQDQSGFISGRCISDNFVYAADLLNCCHKSKAPTIVIKLDFKKAFDSVKWDSLLAILEHRGFPPRFCRWIRDILTTGKTAILLNGIPGPWINCKNGLRQGDPLSPFLFNMVADVLRNLISHACDLGLLAHPIAPNLPCPVLQYADDTLILASATPAAATHLRSILDDFAAATGLGINFHKTTFIPMNVSDTDADSMAANLGTSISHFPQVYLGLPLSHQKLPSSAFVPALGRSDTHLAGWSASLLNKGGRLALLTAVLDSLPTYLMSSFFLSKENIEKLNKKKRAFFWAHEETCTGAQCLVAWDKVCTPKSAGGLGVKNLEIQNVCLLLKFAYKFMHASNLPWRD
jgi:hypothetical protein